MKSIWIISLVAILAFSCTKLNEKNIRGNWEVVKETQNGANVTNKFPSYFTFNSGGEAYLLIDSVNNAIYYSFYWSLDKKGQILTFKNFASDGQGNAIDVPFKVDKSGKKMTITYSQNGFTWSYDLKQTVMY